MAITSTQQTDILKVVAGLFNAAPGGNYLTEMANLVEGGMTISQLADALAAHTLFTNTIMAGKVTTTAQVAVLMNNFGLTVGNTDATSADAQAEAYFTSQIDAGVGFGEIVFDAVTFLSTTTDTAFTTTATLLANKALVAAAYSETTSSTNLSTLQNVLSNVTGTAPYTASDVAAVLAGSGSIGGQTFTLTTSIDVLTGTSGNDTFIGEAASASTGDQITGGAGTDTLRIFDFAGAVDLPGVSGVEIIDLRNPTTTTDFSSVTDLTTLMLNNATTAQTFTAGASVNFELQGMADGEAITLASTTTDTVHNIAVTDMGSIAGAGVTVNADGIAITTINIATSGTIAATTDSDIILASTGTETTVNVTGSGDLALTTSASVVTVDASTATANLTLVTGATASATSIKTGSGNDTVTATAAVNYTVDLGAGDDVLTTSDAAGELTSQDSIVGGDGTDTLAISSAEAQGLDDGDSADSAILAKVTGFEQLRITDALAGDLALNNLGYNYLQVTTDIGADRTITGVTSGFTLESRLAAATSNDYIITMTGATGAGTPSDTINLKLNADLTVNDAMYAVSYDLAGINIVNIAANDRDTITNPDTDANGEEGYTVDLAGGTATNSANITTVNVTGAQKVAYTVNAATTALATYDASAATGEQTFVGTAFAGTQGIVIKGGSKADAITGTALADVIDGGAGDDAIVGGVGADVMTGGAGTDTFTFANTATGLPSATNFDAIADFAKGIDIIDGPVALTISQDGTATAGNAAINAEGIASFDASDDTLAEKLTAVAAAVETNTATTAGDIAIFEHAGDSYVFITDATAGLSATDVLIKLTGVTSLTDSTISGGDLTIL